MSSPNNNRISQPIEASTETINLLAKIHFTREAIADNGLPFMIYTVSVTYIGDQHQSSSWTVDRRFEGFALINEEIVKPLNPSVASYFPTTLDDALLARSMQQLVQERRLALNRYLAALVADQRLVSLDRVHLFLQLDPILGCQVSNVTETFDITEKTTPADFHFIKMIGEGTFARVFLAEHSKQRKFYAIKVIEKNRVEARYVMAERSILQHNDKHPFLVRLHYAFRTEQKLYFVLDFINGGDIFQHLLLQHHFPVERARFYAAEIALALGFLHSRSVIYRDLKLENILLDSEGHVVLTDFGLSREGNVAYTLCGTPEYMAPEMLLQKPFTCAVDWWSLGCALYEMLIGLQPFNGRDHRELRRSIINKPLTLPRLPKLPDEAELILNELLNKDPSQRLGSSNDLTEVRGHRFFSKIDFDLLSKKRIAPPFKPNVASVMSTEQIDDEFTAVPVTSSVIVHDDSALDTDEQNLFDGFDDEFADFTPFQSLSSNSSPLPSCQLRNNSCIEPLLRDDQ